MPRHKRTSKDGMRYSNGKIICWRRGDIILREHMNAHIGELRDSGQYGTGVYCFENLHPAVGLKLGEELIPKNIPNIVTVPLLKLDITELNLYEPQDLSDIEDLSRSLREVVWHILKTPKEAHTIKWLEEYYHLRRDIDFKVDRLIRDDPKLKNIKINIRPAITRTVECIKDKGANACPQPINYVLNMAGFDGIQPFTDQANSGRWGIVIFKKDADKIDCISRKARTGKDREEIPNLCEVEPTKENLEPFLEEERNDKYLQVAAQTQYTHRMDFHHRLHLTPDMTVKEKKTQINKLFNSCLKWAIVYPGMPKVEETREIKNTERQCKLIRDYYLSQVEKESK